MIRHRTASAADAVQRWLDDVFWAGMELSILAVPAYLLLLGATPPGPVALSALWSLVVGALALATLRGNYLGSADWPAAGDLYSIPGRSAYYSLALAGATFAGAWANVAGGGYWVGIVVPAVAVPAALAPLPRVLRAVRRLSKLGTGDVSR